MERYRVEENFDRFVIEDYHPTVLHRVYSTPKSVCFTYSEKNAELIAKLLNGHDAGKDGKL